MILEKLFWINKIQALERELNVWESKEPTNNMGMMAKYMKLELIKQEIDFLKYKLKEEYEN